jgi:hypothetical protein
MPGIKIINPNQKYFKHNEISEWMATGTNPLSIASLDP